MDVGAAYQLAHKFTEIQIENMRRDLRRFVQRAWHIVEPGSRFIGGIHLDAICDHLTYVSIGDIRNLVINIPPRHTKSLTCAVFWPAWEWTWQPWVQWLFSTYQKDLTLRDSVKCRALIRSPWYQERFGGVFQLVGDMNIKSRFHNNHNGYRLATSVDGGNTGEGGHRIVVDDPHNMREINSDVKRAAVIEWWRDTMSTRRNDPKASTRVIIAQRGHHMDLCGYALSTGLWVHLNLPGYFDPKRRCKTIAKDNGSRKYKGEQDIPPPVRLKRFAEPLKKDQIIWHDPRKKKNELLAPDRFGQREMAELAIELTERGFAAQIQQDPVAEGGNIIKRKHWRKWEDNELPVCSMVVQVYDTAFEEEEDNDYSARTTWGIFEHEEVLDPKMPWTAQYKGQKRMCAILLERFNKRVGFPDLREEAKASARKWNPDVILIEKKASGHSLYQELKRTQVHGHSLPVRRIKVSDSKFVRTHAASLVFERGCMFYVDRNWAQEVIEQTVQFPAAEFDDLHDTVVLMSLWLRRRWQAEYLDEDEDDIDLMDQFKKTPAQRRLYGGAAR